MPLLRSDVREAGSLGRSDGGDGGGSGGGGGGGGGAGDSGRIVCVMGPGSFLPGAFAAAPSAVKAATLALMDSMRQELTPTGVDVVAVQPVLDSFTPYLGSRGHALAKASNREISRKDSLFGVVFDRFLEQPHHQPNGSGSDEQNHSFVESEMPLLVPTAQATLEALHCCARPPCSIVVRGWVTPWGRMTQRCLRCKSKEAQHAAAMYATMRPIASDLLQEYGWCQWMVTGMQSLLWWCCLVLIVSLLLI